MLLFTLNFHIQVFSNADLIQSVNNRRDDIETVIIQVTSTQSEKTQTMNTSNQIIETNYVRKL